MAKMTTQQATGQVKAPKSKRPSTDFNKLRQLVLDGYTPNQIKKEMNLFDVKGQILELMNLDGKFYKINLHSRTRPLKVGKNGNMVLSKPLLKDHFPAGTEFSKEITPTQIILTVIPVSQ